MNLPEDFVTRMRAMLGAEADLFFDSYQLQRTYGLRLNPLKCRNLKLPFSLTPVPWAKDGFYADLNRRPGRHPLHEAGAYYIQEPSAMAPVSLLDVKPQEKVCDLCAAPGGKSTQIAGSLLGEGLLVSNEILTPRAKILAQNVERLGAANCVVCNETPDHMAEIFPRFFDKVLVDAPCSGEGMFRKDENAVDTWSLAQVALCADRQKMILSCADRMLAPGGVLVYSTCTFAPQENEQMLAWFLSTYPDYTVEDWRDFLPAGCGLEGGRAEFLEKKDRAVFSDAVQKSLRLFPHKIKGEGHFAVRLRKNGTPAASHATPKEKQKKKPDISGFIEFKTQFLNTPTGTGYSALTCLQNADASCCQYFGDELFLVPALMPSLKGIKIMRAGLALGTRKKNRFEPAHALAMALSPADVRQSANYDWDMARRFLHGDTLPCDKALSSWTLVCCDNLSLGWGKAQNGILKNHYPKGLRTQY